MAYQHTTYVSFRQALAARNQDPLNIYWSDAENSVLVTEALRTFQAMTSFSRARASFATSSNVGFYDLSAVLSSGVLGYSVTDRLAVDAIEYHLLEPANVWSSSTAWNGTAMFTMALVVGALQRRRDQFLSDTAAVLTRSVASVPSTPIGRVPLSDSVIAVRRAAWAAPSAAAAT